MNIKMVNISVVDPEFPVGGGTNLVRGAPTSDAAGLVKCVCQKERIGTFGGGSTTAYD